MSVKRYWSYAGGDSSMQETETGNYVKHEDYVALEQKLTDMAVQLANAESKCRELAAENGRYSMSAGQADQRMSESRSVRSALGFQEDADDVSPSDLVEKIQSLITEQEMLRSAHPQPLGPIMDSAIDAFNSAEMPETGMLNAFFILRDSIIVKTPATDAFLAEVRAQGVEMFASHLRTNDNGASVCKMIALGADEFAAQLRQEEAQ
ncbi:hypothetical protein LT980_19315 [Citrobacter portucalensis]|uniref:hypothetical protein n=1 Tax=Citrobacter portucalensis TaxID=1639133 RepID=UPI00202CDFBA|nr:hypothetical protein [Citrobacter portucalensis]URR12036.1 hypothetical protein LT980_19315 [Citrobacter portucalensis]